VSRSILTRHPDISNTHTHKDNGTLPLRFLDSL